MMTTMHENTENEEEDVVVKYAFTQLNALLQLNSNHEDHLHVVDNQTQTPDNILDEKAKLVLKRLLDCATEHAVKSHAEVIAEKATSSMDQISSQHLTSKEVSKLPCTSSYKIWTHRPGDLPKLFEDLNLGSSASYSKNLCHMLEKNSMERLNSLKKVTSSHDRSLNHSDMLFDAHSGGNHSDHVEINVFDSTLGASNCSLAKAMKRENATKPIGHQILPQAIVDPMRVTRVVGMHHRPGIADLVQDMKIEAFHRSGPMQRERNIPSRTGHWNNGNNKITILADQKSRLSRNSSLRKSKTGRTREGSLPTGMLGHTKAMDQRRHTGAVLTTTLGSTLLRTASVRLHLRKDQFNPVDENHEYWDSDQRSIRIGNKISTSKGRFGKTPRRSHDSHRKITGDEKSAHLPSPIRHLPSRQQKAMARTTSISTSDSSDSTWTGTETSPTDTEDSVPRRTMTRQRVNPTSSYLSSKGSIRPSRRVRHYSMVAPLQAVPMTHTRNTKKQIGRLQRFKNKLGLIFHHHHHHHHHHHNDEAGAGVSHTASSNPSHSFWRSLQKLLHRTSKDTQGKSRWNVGPHQREAEDGIIKGLMRHVWHSKKKSKRSGEVKKLRKMQSRKVVKKWHWWQRFYKRRGVVRQSSIRKPNVRWGGFKGRKPQLRALKHH